MNQIDKNYHQLLLFIAQVKSGKKAIMFGSDCVVLSRNVYDKLVDSKEAKETLVYYDEACKISEIATEEILKHQVKP